MPESFSASSFFSHYISLSSSEFIRELHKFLPAQNFSVTHISYIQIQNIFFCKSSISDASSELTDAFLSFGSWPVAAARMAADGGALRRLFEKPPPENPTLLEALSACNHVHHRKKLVDTASFTEIFGELHFQEKPVDAAAARFLPPPVRAASWIDVADDKSKDDSSLDALLRPKSSAAADVAVKRSASFCLKSSESSLLLCTEGLGTESTVDADDMVKDGDGDGEAIRRGEEETDGVEEDDGAGREKRGTPPTPTPTPTPTTFPPPIRSIGRGGKPCVCFRSFRAEGRFVLMEVVIPGKELLQATREGGRLTLRFANAAAAAAVGGGGGEADDDVNDDDVDR